MNIIVVDDEYHALKNLSSAISEAIPEDALLSIYTFNEPQQALRLAEEKQIDIAFLDIEMCDMNGLMLAKRLKEIHDQTNIVFVTAHVEYASDAFGLHASGYVCKPVGAEDIKKEMEELRYPVWLPDKGLRVQCFGNFEVFYDGMPIYFGRTKAKELFAYLVDRVGSSASNKELAAILWEDKPYDRSKQKQLDTIIVEMLRCLDAVGEKHVIIKKRGSYAVDVSKITCDFYLFQKGNAQAVNSYHGKYMENYSWAEFTAGNLMNS